MVREGDGEADELSYVVAVERLVALISLVGALLVVLEADEREFSLNSTWADVSDLDAVFEHVDAHAFGDGVNGVFCSAVDVATSINLLAGG